MTQFYAGREVISHKPLVKGDPGFNTSKEQSMVTLAVGNPHSQSMVVDSDMVSDQRYQPVDKWYYHGREVTSIRPAGLGDTHYVANTDQVVIATGITEEMRRHPGEVVVPRADLNRDQEASAKYADPAAPGATQTYAGQNVTSVRDAKAGDDGFTANSDQVIVTLADGSTKTIRRADIKTGATPKSTWDDKAIKPAKTLTSASSQTQPMQTKELV